MMQIRANNFPYGFHVDDPLQDLSRIRGHGGRGEQQLRAHNVRVLDMISVKLLGNKL